MKKVLLVLSLICSTAYAYEDNPAALFSTSGNKAETNSIRWVSVNNVQKACDGARAQLGQQAYGAAVRACSFWDNKHQTCTVITEKNVSMHTLGHEIRHCFQGNWHD
jgi:hypothetical protein